MMVKNMQSARAILAIKYSQWEIETFQEIIQTVSHGNIPMLRKKMYALSLGELRRFHQFRKDYLDSLKNLDSEESS